jgi:hypothetical protein
MPTGSIDPGAPGLGRRLIIGPDHKLRFIWRAAIFWTIAYYGFPLILDPLFGRAGAWLHIDPGLGATNIALGEFENFLVALICTGIFALYERRRVDSYGLPLREAA